MTLLAPRQSLLVLVALVPIVAAAVLVVVRLYGLSWYAAAGLFYAVLSVVQIGYFGILVTARAGDEMSAPSCPMKDEVRTPG